MTCIKALLNLWSSRCSATFCRSGRQLSQSYLPNAAADQAHPDDVKEPEVHDKTARVIKVPQVLIELQAITWNAANEQVLMARVWVDSGVRTGWHFALWSGFRFHLKFISIAGQVRRQSLCFAFFLLHITITIWDIEEVLMWPLLITKWPADLDKLAHI